MSERYVEYSASVRQQITASVELVLCTDCGALVGDTEKHNRWHEWKRGYIHDEWHEDG